MRIFRQYSFRDRVIRIEQGQSDSQAVDEKQGIGEVVFLGKAVKEYSRWISAMPSEQSGVKYHLVYLSKFLKVLCLSYAIPRTKRPSQPENTEEILNERVDNALTEDTHEHHNKREGGDDEGWVVDDDICTDGGTVSNFSIHRIHSRTTTHTGCGIWMIRIMSDRWFRFLNQRSNSMHSMVKV